MIDSIPKTDSSGNSSELEFLAMGMRYKQGQGGISLDGSTPVSGNITGSNTQVLTLQQVSIVLVPYR